MIEREDTFSRVFLQVNRYWGNRYNAVHWRGENACERKRLAQPGECRSAADQGLHGETQSGHRYGKRMARSIVRRLAGISVATQQPITERRSAIRRAGGG